MKWQNGVQRLWRKELLKKIFSMNKRLLAIILLVVYYIILIRILVFKNLPMIQLGGLRLKFGGTHEAPTNLVPFKTILSFLFEGKGFIIGGLNIVGNIILFVPIGFLFPYVYKHMTWKKTLALAVAAGLIIEGMQAILQVGIFDIDDVILNGLGVIIGYWVFLIFRKKQTL